MRQEVFTLPSSAKIEFGQVLVAHENKMAAAIKAKRANVDRVLSQVMTDVATGVVDPGPYDFLEVGGKPDWDRMLKGDRLVGMLDVRKLSYRDGHLYDAKLRCPQLACSHKFDWEINLNEDITRIDLTPDAIQHLKDGKPFEATIADHVVSFTHALGKTEELYNRLCDQYPGRDMACALRCRIVGVEGIQPRDIMDWLDGNNGESSAYDGLTSQDAEDLREAFDEVEGGIDTSMEAQCPRSNCRTWFDFELPFSGMFLPGRGIGKRFKKERARRRQAAIAPQTEETTVAPEESEERSSPSEDSPTTT